MHSDYREDARLFHIGVSYTASIPKPNKRPKNFYNRSHHRGGVFTREKFMWHRPDGSNAVGSSRFADAVTEFLLHTRQQWIAMHFNGLENHKNAPYPEGSEPNLRHGSLGPTSLPSNRHLEWFSHFCKAHERDQQTDRQTDYATPSEAVGHIQLSHCMMGHLTCKIVSEMTYNVSSGTLNPTIPIPVIAVMRPNTTQHIKSHQTLWYQTAFVGAKQCGNTARHAAWLVHNVRNLIAVCRSRLTCQSHSPTCISYHRYIR